MTRTERTITERIEAKIEKVMDLYYSQVADEKICLQCGVNERLEASAFCRGCSKTSKTRN
jgi:hypothetical protein